jgi:hypothetical protein
LSSNSPIANRVWDPGPALVAVERGDLAVDKAPIDLRGQLRQLVLQIDDLIEPRPEQIVRTLALCCFGRIVPSDADSMLCN